MLSDHYGETADAKDAQFQLGATYAEMENWPASAEVFALILQRKDLTADDKMEALGRRGFAQFKLKDLDTAERTFKSAVAFFEQIEVQERLQTDFYLGLCKYHLGEIPHERFRAGAAAPAGEADAASTWTRRRGCCCFAQRKYIDTIKLGNPQWASASGYQVASLYEEFYDAFMHAPVPPELLGAGNEEKREIYFDELRKNIRILLEKSLRVERAESIDDGAPGRAERVARQVQARLRQAAAAARPERAGWTRLPTRRPRPRARSRRHLRCPSRLAPARTSSPTRRRRRPISRAATRHPVTAAPNRPSRARPPDLVRSSGALSRGRLRPPRQPVPARIWPKAADPGMTGLDTRL